MQFTAKVLLIQKIYTLPCLAVTVVAILVFHYGYCELTHSLINNLCGNGLNDHMITSRQLLCFGTCISVLLWVENLIIQP